jgi:hypothetical protein
MANNKLSAEEAYAVYTELYRKKRRIEVAVERLQKKLEGPQQELDRQLEHIKAQVTDDLIEQASKDFEMEVLQRINQLVAKQANLAEAVELLSALERHFQLRLQPGGKPLVKIEPPPEPTPTPEPEPPLKPVPPTPPPAPAPEKTEKKEIPLGKPRERLTLVEGRLTGVVRYRYDQQGRTAMEDYFDSQGNKVGSWERAYDTDGKLEVLFGRNRVAALIEQAVFEYNTEGKMYNEIIQDNSGTMLWSCSYHYDRQGRIIKRLWRNSRGKVTKSWEYHYEGDADKASKVIWKDEHHRSFGFSEYLYDDAGLLIVETRKDNHGGILKVLNFQYRF